MICGSQRFKEELDAFVRFLRKSGVVVNFPNFLYHRKRQIALPEKVRLRSSAYKVKIPGMVLGHLDKIKQVGNMGGICLIFNPKANRVRTVMSGKTR